MYTVLVYEKVMDIVISYTYGVVFNMNECFCFYYYYYYYLVILF